MGYPVSHSRSPVIHRLFALQSGENMQYELLQVSPEKLEMAIRQFQRTGGKGLNITVPHKSEVARFVDKTSDRAAIAGAVNTLAFTDGEIHGDNTDGIGLLRDLAVNLGVSVEGANILILGAGGATRGIVGAAAGNAAGDADDRQPVARQGRSAGRTLLGFRATYRPAASTRCRPARPTI